MAIGAPPLPLPHLSVCRCICDVLLNMPPGSAACFVTPPSLQEAGKEPESVFNGFDMSAVSKALGFLQWKLVGSAVCYLTH